MEAEVLPVDARHDRFEEVTIRLPSDVHTTLSVAAFRRHVAEDAIVEAALRHFASLSEPEQTRIVARAVNN